VGTLHRCSLVTLTFDLSTFKWVMGFLPIFSFLRPSVLDLGSGMGQTDGQTTAISALHSHPIGEGHKN